MSRHNGILQMFVMAVCGMAMNACTADDPAISPDADLSKAVKVSARIADHVYTRGYQEDGPVVEGKYYLSYPANNQNRNYEVAIVDFDAQSSEAPGLGIVNTPSGSELKWSDIGGSPVTFYLDNVSRDLGDGPTVTFTDNNPYAAAIFDDTDGSNDLLWGEKSVNSGTRSLGFDLHHNMSRVKVQVEVIHEDNSVEDITLDGATVKITGLYPRPLSYNRLDGTFELDEDSYGDIFIVDPSSSSPGYDWVDTDESDVTKTIYYSPDIVLPPQALAEDDTRSRLEITLDNGKVYSGILPHAMMIANSADQTLNYPVTLAFLKEYVLTIRTVITEEPPELAFMPVWVTEWVDKGEFTLEAHQSGIYTSGEFYKLTDYYSKLNEYQLVRYGYLTTPEGESNQIWLFNFFSSVTLDFNSIAGTMRPGILVEGKGTTKNFTFSFNNYTVYVSNGNDETKVPVSENQLYRIVTGSLDWNQLTR